MFTRKHYKAIAGIIEKHHLEADTFAVKTAVWQIADELVDLFLTDNERFIPSKFMNACGFPDGKAPL